VRPARVAGPPAAPAGDRAKHLLHIAGPLLGNRYLGLRHCNKEQNIKARQLHRPVNHLGRIAGLGQFRNPQDLRGASAANDRAACAPYFTSVIGLKLAIHIS